MPDTPEGVYALDAQHKLELAMALMARARRAEDGRRAFQAAYPEAPAEMVRVAAHHVYNDGAPPVWWLFSSGFAGAGSARASGSISTERNTLRVLVSIFGRATPVELDFLQVEKA